MADEERTAANRTTPELLAGLLQQGGKILVVGGAALADLPERFLEYPRLLFWNDDKQGIEQKEVPQNTRAILVHRWMSHTVVWRMRNAAKQLQIPVLPNLRTREVKELLAGIMGEVVEAREPIIETIGQAQFVTGLEEVFEREFPGRLTEDETPIERVETQGEGAGVMAKKGTGKLKTFIAKYIDVDADYTQVGSVKREGDRLMEIARRERLATTEGSMLQGISVCLKQLGIKTSGRGRPGMQRRSKRTVPATPTADRITEGTAIRGVGRVVAREDGDFEDFERLIDDAITAMKLIKETLPQIKREVSDFRKQRAKLRELLG